MVMWGVGKDEMKGKHVLLTTTILYEIIEILQMLQLLLVSFLCHLLSLEVEQAWAFFLVQWVCAFSLDPTFAGANGLLWVVARMAQLAKKCQCGTQVISCRHVI